MKDDRDWIPDATDLDWIECDQPAAAARRSLAIEAAAEPLGIPIVDRHSGRVLSVLAGDRRRIVEVGTAYGYSTRLDGPRPASRRHDRHDRPGPRADRSRPRLVARGRHRRRADQRGHCQGARGLRRARPGSRGAVRHGVHRRAQARIRGVPRCADRRPAGAGRARRRRQRPVERPCRALAADDPADANTTGLRRFCERVLGDDRFSATILPVGDGLLIATWRG